MARMFLSNQQPYGNSQTGNEIRLLSVHEDTGYVSEAKIKRILLQEDSMKFFEVYSCRIFLTREELKEYIES